MDSKNTGWTVGVASHRTRRAPQTGQSPSLCSGLTQEPG